MAWLGRENRGRRAVDRAEGETNDLIFFIIIRFVLVLFVVMVAESLVVWIESVSLLPLLQGFLSDGVSSEATTSVISLLRLIIVLLTSMAQANYLQMAGVMRSSQVAVLLIIMLLLLCLPPLLGALVFSRAVVRKLRELQASRDIELAQIDQQRSQFMTDIAHDLRTPLMAISGMSHAILDGVVPGEEMRSQYLQSICDKADKMGDLVSSVFEYTKLGSGAFALEREQVDLPQLLLKEAATAYPDIEEASMLLSVYVPEDRCLIDADPVQLARVVANLLTNAVRHNQAGTEIALLLVRQAGVAYVIVADTGDRITDDPDDLFQPFSRGDAARSEVGGSGLGLSICKRIADLHGYRLLLVQPYGRFTKAFVLQCSVTG